MKRYGTLGLALVAVLIAAPAAAQTVDEIIAQYVETRGGAEAWKAVETARLKGKISMGGAMEAPFVVEFKDPNKVRIEFTLQGMTGVQAFDGESGWMIMPFAGKTDPEDMGPDMLKQIREQADFDGVLVDYVKKGHTVELVGKEEVEGTEAYKLKVTRKNGDVDYQYLDTEHHLVFRIEGKRTIMGVDQEFVSNVGDYKEVGDIIFPHSIEQGGAEGPAMQTFTVESVELNVDIPDDRFTRPAPAAPEPVEGE